MPALRPQPRELVGRYIRLVPLQPSDFAALHKAIGRPEVFAYGYGGGMGSYRETVEAFEEWAARHFDLIGRNVYGVYLVGGQGDGVLVGTSSLGDFDEGREHAHIGWTAYHPAVWSTAVNPEAKLLLLAEAFEAGFGRVKIQTDSINARSRAAIGKLGAQFEGIVRRDIRRADGSWRDSALFSILVDEWPAVREGLESRLDGYGGQPVPFDASDAAASD